MHKEVALNYTLAVFKTRYATLNFANLLKANNVPMAIINTPSSISRTCGISVKFLSAYFAKVQTLLGTNLSNFAGFYSYTQTLNGVNIFKL